MTADACPKTDELSAWLDDNADEGESSSLEAHIENCTRCQDVLNRLTSEEATFEAASVGQTYGAEPRCREAVELIRHLVAETRSQRTASQSLPIRLIETDAIDNYQLLAELGRGGMGVVFRVRSRQRGGQFALKILTSERFRQRTARDRFAQEIRHLNRVRHPNLVEAIDSGEWRGLPYLVMECLGGIDLARLTKLMGPLAIADACEITRQAAEGLSCLHDAGLMHRDVKPSNMMLTGDAVVKVLDLGLARAADLDEMSHELTRSAQVLGTLHYIAPEQLTDPRKIDARCDMYSLGAGLFWLLTGHPPYSGPEYESPYQIMAGHAAGPLPDAAARRDDLPMELAEVLSRMLAKEPDERVSSMRELARSLEPFASSHGLAALMEEAIQPAAAKPATQEEDVPLRIQLPVAVGDDEGRTPGRDGEPAARPMPSWGKRATLAMLMAVLLVGAALVFHLRRLTTGPSAHDSRPPEQPPASGPSRSTSPAGFAVRHDDESYQERQTDPAVDSLLDRSFRWPEPSLRLEPKPVNTPPGAPLGAHALVSAPAPVEGVRSWTIETRLPRGRMMECAFSRDGRCYAAAGTSGVIRVFDSATDRLVQLIVGRAAITSLDWSSSGPYLSASAVDGSVTVWDVREAKLVREFRHSTGWANVARWSPDGLRLAFGGQNAEVPIHNLSSEETIRVKGLPGGVEALAWSPDGGKLAFGGYRGEVGLWHLDTKQPKTLLREKGETVRVVAWHPIESLLAVFDDELVVRVFDLSTREVRREFCGHLNTPCRDILWSPNGSHLVTNDGAWIRFWDLESDEPVRSILNPTGEEFPNNAGSTLEGMSLGADGRSLAVAMRFLGSVWRYDLATDQAHLTTESHTKAQNYDNMAWSRDGRLLAIARREEGIRLFDTANSELVSILPGGHDGIGQVSWSPDGDRLVAAEGGKTVVWSHLDEQEPRRTVFTPGSNTCCEWSPDGVHLAAGSRRVQGGKASVHRADEAEPVRVFPVGQRQLTDLSWSPDSSRLACACQQNVTILNAVTGEKLHDIPSTARVWDLAWHPNGHRIVTMAENGRVEMTDLKTGQTTLLTDHRAQGRGIAWSSDGAYLASSCRAELRLLSISDRSLVWSVPSGRAGSSSLLMSPDDSMLALYTELGLHFVDISNGKRLATLASLNNGHWLLLSPSGHYRGSRAVESELLVVAETTQGQQVMMLQDFTDRFGWRNDPEQAVFPVRAPR